MKAKEIDELALEISGIYNKHNYQDAETFAASCKSLIKILLSLDDRLIKEIEEYNPEFQEIFDSINYI